METEAPQSRRSGGGDLSLPALGWLVGWLAAWERAVLVLFASLSMLDGLITPSSSSKSVSDCLEKGEGERGGERGREELSARALIHSLARSLDADLAPATRRRDRHGCRAVVWIWAYWRIPYWACSYTHTDTVRTTTAVHPHAAQTDPALLFGG